jgi:hypothetical protein
MTSADMSDSGIGLITDLPNSGIWLCLIQRSLLFCLAQCTLRLRAQYGPCGILRLLFVTFRLWILRLCNTVTQVTLDSRSSRCRRIVGCVCVLPFEMRTKSTHHFTLPIPGNHRDSFKRRRRFSSRPRLSLPPSQWICDGLQRSTE